MKDIFYICKYAHRYTLRSYLTMVRQPDDPQIHLLTYEMLAGARTFRTENIRPASYVFTDMDRAAPRELAAAATLAGEIRAKGPGHRVINDPTNVAERFELLRLLHLHGINRFNAYLLVEHAAPERWPVFVRATRGGSGGPSELVHDAAALEAAIFALARDGVRRESIMIVEFQPTDRLNGNVVKYGAYCVAGKVFPGHVHVCTDWRSKLDSAHRVLDAEVLELEQAWFRDMAYREEVARAFEIAGIEYGRIDFGLVDGQPQFWEINTNPDLLALPRSPRDQVERDPIMLPVYLPILRQIFESLAAGADD